jgi:hypothetical protein
MRARLRSGSESGPLAGCKPTSRSARSSGEGRDSSRNCKPTDEDRLDENEDQDVKEAEDDEGEEEEEEGEGEGDDENDDNDDVDDDDDDEDDDEVQDEFEDDEDEEVQDEFEDDDDEESTPNKASSPTAAHVPPSTSARALNSSSTSSAPRVQIAALNAVVPDCPHTYARMRQVTHMRTRTGACAVKQQ